MIDDPIASHATRVRTDSAIAPALMKNASSSTGLKSPARGQISLKVSEKGGVSVYGLGRFPVTLYKEQWTKLLATGDQIKSFIEKNDHLLKKKE